MAKNPIKVSASVFSTVIYAGRVNEQKGIFIGDKEDVTDSAVNAVAEYLLNKQVTLHFTHRNENYILQVVKAPAEVSEQSEDIELNAIADSRKDSKRIKVNLDDL